MLNLCMPILGSDLSHREAPLFYTSFEKQKYYDYYISSTKEWKRYTSSYGMYVPGMCIVIERNSPNCQCLYEGPCHCDNYSDLPCIYFPYSGGHQKEFNFNNNGDGGVTPLNYIWVSDESFYRFSNSTDWYAGYYMSGNCPGLSDNGDKIDGEKFEKLKKEYYTYGKFITKETCFIPHLEKFTLGKKFKLYPCSHVYDWLDKVCWPTWHWSYAAYEDKPKWVEKNQYIKNPKEITDKISIDYTKEPIIVTVEKGWSFNTPYHGLNSYGVSHVTGLTTLKNVYNLKNIPTEGSYAWFEMEDIEEGGGDRKFII